MKKVLSHGITAGLLAAIAAIVYNIIYCQAMEVNFSSVVNPFSIAGASIFSCLLASVGYFLFAKWVSRGTDVWFNIIFLIISFATFFSVFDFTLPMTVQSSELFPGLTIPMHLMPVLFWIAAKPLFY